MHQTISLIVTFFLFPINWILMLIVAQYIFKSDKAKKICRGSAIAIFFIFTNIFLITWYANWWQPKPRDVSNDAPYSCGILLGGFGSPDYDGKGYFNATADRFIQTVKLYKQQKIQHILVSGGNGKATSKTFSEGNWVGDELKAMGVPDSAIIFEDKSNNTAENAANSKILLDSLQLKPPYLLITSAHHVPRASLIFKNAGISTVAFPCAYVAGKDGISFRSFIPSVEILFRWNHYIKETFAYIVYKIIG